jgi:hypothetical protein
MVSLQQCPPKSGFCHVFKALTKSLQSFKLTKQALESWQSKMTIMFCKPEHNVLFECTSTNHNWECILYSYLLHFPIYVHRVKVQYQFAPARNIYNMCTNMAHQQVGIEKLCNDNCKQEHMTLKIYNILMEMLRENKQIHWTRLVTN